MDTWTVIASTSGAIGTLVAAIALINTIRLHRNQAQLTVSIHSQQMLLAQRQILLPLWEYLQDLNDINPENPVWPDVIKAANTLELVAVSWEGQLIDENIIRRMFNKQFIEFYQKIEECKNPPSGVRLSGREMLLENKAATKLYKQLSYEYMNQNKLAPIK